MVETPKTEIILAEDLGQKMTQIERRVRRASIPDWLAYKKKLIGDSRGMRINEREIADKVKEFRKRHCDSSFRSVGRIWKPSESSHRQFVFHEPEVKGAVNFSLC